VVDCVSKLSNGGGAVGLLLTSYRCPPMGLPGPPKAVRSGGATERASATTRCRGAEKAPVLACLRQLPV
jgi:hypothetical protein